MNILSLDTAASACSCALWQKDRITHWRFEEMQRGHAQALLPMIDDLMKDSGLDFKDLTALGVTIGPGAFTGLRIALATARGLATACDLPLIGVSTLETLNAALSDTERAGRTLLCALDAKRADLYVQAFDGKAMPLFDPLACLPQSVPGHLQTTNQKILIAGDSFERIAPPIEEAGLTPIKTEVRLPDARAVCKLVAERGVDHNAVRPSALYIRPPDAVIPKNQGRLRP